MHGSALQSVHSLSPVTQADSQRWAVSSVLRRLGILTPDLARRAADGLTTTAAATLGEAGVKALSDAGEYLVDAVLYILQLRQQLAASAAQVQQLQVHLAVMMDQYEAQKQQVAAQAAQIMAQQMQQQKEAYEAKLQEAAQELALRDALLDALNA